MITRSYSDKMKEYLEPNKVLVIYGSRQSGKTTLLKEFLSQYSGKVYSSTGQRHIRAHHFNASIKTAILILLRNILVCSSAKTGFQNSSPFQMILLLKTLR